MLEHIPLCNDTDCPAHAEAGAGADDVRAVRKSHLAAALGFQNVTLIFIEGGEAEQNIMKVLKGKKSFIFLRMKSFIMILVGFFHRM